MTVATEQMVYAAMDHLHRSGHVISLTMLQAALNAALTVASQPSVKARVVIEVSGGVADVTHCDDNVDVEIIDHDNNEAEEG